MRPISYVYFLDLVTIDASSIQALSTIKELGKHRAVTVCVPWVSRYRLRKLSETWNLPESIRFVRIPGFSPPNSSRLQDVGRILYTVMSFLFLVAGWKKAVFTRDISLPLLLSYLPRLLRPRLELTLELHKIYFRATNKVSFAREAAAYSVVRRFVCTTRAASRDLRHHFQVAPGRIVTLPNGVDVGYVRGHLPASKRTPSSARNGKPSKIVYSGTFAAWKGVDLLVEACSFLEAGSYQLVLVGATPPEKARLQETCQTLGIASHVAILPRLSRPHALRIVAECDCAVVPNPPSAEGTEYTCPIKVFEYLALGLPIVASRLPSLREILVEGEHAEFFRPEDPRDLAEKIAAVISGPDKRAHMAEKNVDLACRHTWKQRAAALHAFIG